MTEGRAGQATAWFHCFSGIAGDMALASLLDAGADLEEVLGLLRRLPLGGWGLERHDVLRGGIAATRLEVVTRDDVVVRTHAHIVGLVTEGRLPERVAKRALAVFDALASAEGRLHRRPPAQVHFHEVGGHDAVVEVVGTAAALEVLGVDEVTTSPVATGTGTIRTAHGLLPNPAPAVVELLAGVPVVGLAIPHELTTPTGAALVAALATRHGPLPALRVRSSGFGAGSKDLDELPNVTQAVIGIEEPPEGAEGQPVTLLEANVDDATGEQLALAVSTLLEAGAFDAWVTPCLMKKGRPGHTVHALVDPANTAPLRHLLRRSTGSLGVRAVTTRRWPVRRQEATVRVEGQAVRLKVTGERVKPEFDDLVAAATTTGRTPAELAALAVSAWLEGVEETGGSAGSRLPPTPPGA